MGTCLYPFLDLVRLFLKVGVVLFVLVRGEVTEGAGYSGPTSLQNLELMDELNQPHLLYFDKVGYEDQIPKTSKPPPNNDHQRELILSTTTQKKGAFYTPSIGQP